MKIESVARLGNTLTFLSPSGEGIGLSIGDVIQADVLSTQADGTVSIRITTESGKSGVVAARSDVRLEKGETILLKMVGGEREVVLRFLGVVAGEGKGPDGIPALPEAFRKLASELAALRLPSAGAREALESLRLLPGAVKEGVRGMAAALCPDPVMQGIDGARIKEGLERFGPEMKDALLRLRETLADRLVSEAVKASGKSPGGTAVTVDSLLSTMDSYQLASAVNGVLSSPLLLDWDELVDGEMIFRKRRRGKGESYTCDLSLDLRPLGKMSVSITMYDGSFYVSFFPESEETRSLVASRSDEIGMRLRGAGLALTALNVNRRNNVALGVSARDVVDLEV